MSGASSDLEKALHGLMRVNRLVAELAGSDYARLIPRALALKAQIKRAHAVEEEAFAAWRRIRWVPVFGHRARQKISSAETQLKLVREALARLRERAQSLLRAQQRSHALEDPLLKLMGAAAKHSTGDEEATATEVSIVAQVRALATDKHRQGDHERTLERVTALASEIRAILISKSSPRDAPSGRAVAVDDERSPPMAKPSHSQPRKGQFILDFDGSGRREEEPRIWLPVSVSRAREMLERGARMDRSAANRGSKLWVPVSERHLLDSFLPLAFRAIKTHLRYPPIRHNAVGANLHSIFDKSSWNHIRSAAYDRAGHRCQLCGKQGGSLWNRLARTEEKKVSGPVDCHEVWEWERSTSDGRVGIQRLARLLVLCKDCHLSFHEGYAKWRAEQVGLEDRATAYLHNLRCLVNGCDDAEMAARMSEDREAHKAVRDVQKWVIDLSHLAAQDYMADHTLTLQTSNKAGVGPDRVGGIAYRLEDGTSFAAVSPENLANGSPPRVLSFATPAAQSSQSPVPFRP